jgi:hypothetical protein
MKKTFILVCLCLIGSALLAQNKSLAIGRLFGKIVEKQTMQAIPFTSIAVYQTVNKKDSLIAGTLAKDNGEFTISDLAFGKYKVKITALGFKELQQNVAVAPPENVEVDLGNILLENDPKLLETVEIAAEKSTTQWAIDKKIVNVDKNINAQGGSMADVLKNVPSVTMDGDGAVLLRNQTPLIYIDGRPTPLSIQQIPANQIEQIEVITNPSARYEASASGGIINLVLKKNKQIGLNGNYGLGAGLGNRLTALGNVNYKENPFNFTLFSSFNTASYGVEGYNNRVNRNNGVATDFQNQYINSDLGNRTFSARANLDYNLNIRNTLSLTASTTFATTLMDDALNFDILNASQQRLAYGNRTTDFNNNASDYVISGTWRRTFLKKGRELIANFNSNWGNIDNRSDFNTVEYAPNGTQLRQKPIVQRNIGTVADLQNTFTFDYFTPINDSTKLEMGVRSMWNTRSNMFNSDSLSDITDSYQSLKYLCFDYNFNNIVNATYVNVLGKLKRGWSYQAGFRYEQSNFIGTSNLNGKDFSYTYPSDASSLLKTLFPSVYLNKKINATTEWQLNFSRKIGRPTYTQMTPFIIYSDRNSQRMGNPELRPEFINLAEINYNKTLGKANISSALYFRKVNDPIVINAYREAQNPNLIVTTFVNGNKNRSYGFDNTVKYAFSKNVEWLVNINALNTYFAFNNYENEGWTWNGKTTLTAKLPKDFTSQISGNYETPSIVPQGTRGGMYFVDFTLRKELFNKTGTLSLIVSDIFDSKRTKIIYDTPQYFNEFMRRREARYIRLTFQKRFGKMDASIFKPKRAGNKSVREQALPEE